MVLWSVFIRLLTDSFYIYCLLKNKLQYGFMKAGKQDLKGHSFFQFINMFLHVLSRTRFTTTGGRGTWRQPPGVRFAGGPAVRPTSWQGWGVNGAASRWEPDHIMLYVSGPPEAPKGSGSGLFCSMKSKKHRWTGWSSHWNLFEPESSGVLLHCV